MKLHRLMGLALLALVLLGGALWYASDRRPSQPGEQQALLVPGLADRLNALEQVRIVGAGDQTLVTIKRNAAGWQVAERGDFPVDTAKLRELLLKLAGARRIEQKTSSPERYARLGVEDVDTPEAASLRLELTGGGDPVSLLVGVSKLQGEGTYVREAGQPQSWLTDLSIKVAKAPADWLAQELINLTIDRIARVDVQPVGGAAIAIARSDDTAGDFRLLDVPKGREPASEFVADATAGLLTDLKLEDVLAADSQSPGGAGRHARFLTREGLVVDIDSWQEDGKTIARLLASKDEARATAWIDAEQARQVAEWQSAQAAATPATDTAAPNVNGETPSASPTGEAVSATVAASVADQAVSDAEAPITNTAEAPAAVSDPEADRSQRLQQLDVEIAAINARVANRVFVLPSFKAANLNRDLDAYLKAKN